MTSIATTGSAVSRRAVLAGLAGMAALPRAFAQGTAAAPDLSGVIERGRLTIAMPGFSSAPFFSGGAGPSAGLDIETANDLAAALQVGASFDRSPTTFDMAVDRLATGQADLAICKLSRTLTRGRIIRYSRPYAVLNHGLIANRVRLARMTGGNSAGEVVRDFRGELGVIAHSSFAEFAAISFPNAAVREYESWGDMVEAVRHEEIDMAYRDDFEIKKLLVDDPSLTVVARTITLTDKTDTLAIGIRPGAPHLASFVDLFLDLARGGAVMKTNELIARYRAEIGA